MKEAFLGGESRKRFESMIAEEDWLCRAQCKAGTFAGDLRRSNRGLSAFVH
jgi:hypothetical protein